MTKRGKAGRCSEALDDHKFNESLRAMQERCSHLEKALLSERVRVQEARDSEARAIAALGEMENKYAAIENELSAVQALHAVAQQKRDGHYRKLVAEQERSKQLSEDLRSMQELYATAQQKRDGHYLHLMAERSRSKALLEIAQSLHAENQVFKNSIALKLGNALLAMRAPAGMLRFPFALISSLREKRARPDGRIQTVPFVPPPHCSCGDSSKKEPRSKAIRSAYQCSATPRSQVARQRGGQASFRVGLDAGRGHVQASHVEHFR